jgi:glyoxylase-like metal-dependent hydrolase (beta-lactamase superfamily II)
VAKVQAPERVAPGVYRVDAIGLPHTVSVLILEGEDGFTLVDTGLESSVGRIQQALAALGGGPEDLGCIYLTHHHLDHISGLPNLRRWAPGVEVVASEHEAEIVSGGRGPDPPSNALIRFFSRYQSLPPVPVDRVAREGDAISGFRVVSTPGHTLGHTSLLRDEDGLLFTGDAFGVLVRRVGVGVYRAPCTDPPLAKRSAEKLLAEEFGTVVMTHGKPLHVGARRRLGEAMARCTYA